MYEKSREVAVWLHDNHARLIVGAAPANNPSRWAIRGTIVEEIGVGPGSGPTRFKSSVRLLLARSRSTGSLPQPSSSLGGMRLLRFRCLRLAVKR